MAVDIYIGKVVSTNDPLGGDRLKIRVYPLDTNKTEEEIPYSVAALPKVFSSKPKLGEAALVIISDPNTPNSLRYYLGPVISQMTDLERSDYEGMATSVFRGTLAKPEKNIKNDGLFGEDNDTAIYGRGDTDIILSDDDIRIRCGSRKMDQYTNPKVVYNKNAAYIKLKEHKSPLKTNISDTYGEVNNETQNDITLVADKINLISTDGNPKINFEDSDKRENISDKKMSEIIERAYRLPYGEVLVDFLYSFLRMFSEHSHPSNGDTPIVGDNASQEFYNEFAIDKKKLGEKLLSKNIRIN